MATIIFTPSMLHGAGTRGVPAIPKSGGGGDTGLATISNAFSMAFNGTDEYLSSPISMSALTGLSVSAWAYPTATGTGAAEAIVSTDIASAPRGFYLALYNGSNFRWQISTNGSTKTSCDSPGGSLPGLNQWIHVVGTWDATNMKVYINGSLSKTISSGVANGTFSTTNDILIGARETTAGYFPGSIDEVAVFTSTLDAPTVESIYSASLPLGSGVTGDLSKLDTPPVAWYRMGD